MLSILVLITMYDWYYFFHFTNDSVLILIEFTRLLKITEPNIGESKILIQAYLTNIAT